MPLSTAGLNQAANAILVDRIRLHSGDPGAAGTSNTLGAGLTVATFSAASNGVRSLSAPVTITGLGANQSVTHISFWQNTGSVFLGSQARTSGDTAANAAGEYTVTTGTSIGVYN